MPVHWLEFLAAYMLFRTAEALVDFLIRAIHAAGRWCDGRWQIAEPKEASDV